MGIEMALHNQTLKKYTVAILDAFNNIKIPHSGNRTTRINNPKKQINF